MTDSFDRVIVRRLQTAAIRSMTGRILEEARPEGNLRIMSPYVMAFRGNGLAENVRCRHRTESASNPYARVIAHYRAT
ncbi:hypothetical protein [Paraburkholderia caffeinilytica]|uniref:hypothetical protein n=1 Tax=Paraburkholderia caffeinilytica TaxID=1761016 RepID=UPI0038BC4B5B